MPVKVHLPPCVQCITIPIIGKNLGGWGGAYEIGGLGVFENVTTDWKSTGFSESAYFMDFSFHVVSRLK